MTATAVSPTVPVINFQNEPPKKIRLAADVFNSPATGDLIAQVVTTQINNARQPIASTKDRGEVAGSNKKPWRQKGTGNARAGSARSPLWRGGGITFGPTPLRSYASRLPQKMKRAAWRGVLTDLAVSHKLVIVETLDHLDGKTRGWVESLERLNAVNVKAGSRVVVADGQCNPLAERSIRNVKGHVYRPIEQVTLRDLLAADRVILTRSALENLTGRLSATAKKASQ